MLQKNITLDIYFVLFIMNVIFISLIIMTKLDKKKLVLTFSIMMMPVQSNDSIISITSQSNKNVISVLSQTPTDGQGETITFKDAKNMKESQGLFEEMIDNERIKVLIDKYGYEEVQKVLKEINFDENTERRLKILLEDEKIQQALKEGNEDLVKEKVSDECKTHVGWIVSTIMVEVLAAFIYYFRKKLPTLNKPINLSNEQNWFERRKGVFDYGGATVCSEETQHMLLKSFSKEELKELKKRLEETGNEYILFCYITHSGKLIKRLNATFQCTCRLKNFTGFYEQKIFETKWDFLMRILNQFNVYKNQLIEANPEVEKKFNGCITGS